MGHRYIAEAHAMVMKQEAQVSPPTQVRESSEPRRAGDSTFALKWKRDLPRRGWRAEVDGRTIIIRPKGGEWLITVDGKHVGGSSHEELARRMADALPAHDWSLSKAMDALHSTIAKQAE